MKKTLTIFLLTLFVNICAFSQTSLITESLSNFKTYPFSDPNPVPKVGRIYPYFRFDGYTNTAIQKDWKTITMENDFVKVSVLPEIGGKIWGAYEKSKNFPFIYYNHVVKFRDVAMRGAWTSGGIEINFGDIGHAPSCSNPVDYFTRFNTDGSVSTFLSATDWASRTTWTVEVNLPKDKGYFTTKSKWYNATPLAQSYYHWMNAGFKAKGNLEFTYEGSNFIGHAGEIGGWKKDSSGHEINFYEKNNFGTYKSYHVLGKKTDFFGGYWHDDKMGFGHYSNYGDKLGKKIWIWGLAREGMIWEKLLTDNDGQYVELQSGRLFNQAAAESIESPFKHVSFQPYTSDSFTEYWFPVNGTNGIADASPKGAVNKKGNKIYFSTLHKITDTLYVFADNQLIMSKYINLKPLEKLEETIEDREKISIYLGSEKLFDETEENTLNRPLEKALNFDWNSEYGLYMKGKDLAAQRNYVEAKVFLEKALKKNANLLPAIAELAQIYYRQGQFEEAFNLLRKALSIDTYDGHSNFLWGLVNEKLRNDADVIDGYSVAALNPNFRSAALTRLAMHYARKNDWKKANEFSTKCHEEFPQNIDNQNLMMVINRKFGNNCRAEIEMRLEENPLDHFARAEKFFQTADKEQFTSLIRNELPHETFIELAAWYAQIGQNAEALKIIELAPDQPMVNYWKAYLSDKLGKSFIETLKKAESASINFVFPFRIEEIDVLKWAEKIIPNIKNQYYLGLLYWQNNRILDAKAAFQKCEEMNDIPFLLAKAELFHDDKAIAEQSLRRAYILEPNNWRVVKAFCTFLSENKRYVDALATIESAYLKNNENYILGQLYAKQLFYNQQFAKALEMMQKLEILPNEGATETHSLFREANIMAAIDEVKLRNYSKAIEFLNLAETFPENLGSGEPYEPNNVLTQKMKTAIQKRIKPKPTAKKSGQFPFIGKSRKEKDELFWQLFTQNFK